MPQSYRVDGLLAKEESTYGTDSTPAAGTDGVRVSQRVFSNLQVGFEFPNLRRDVANGGLLSAAPAPPGGRFCRVQVGWDARGAGAAYSSSTPVRPEADPLLVACGYQRTHDDTGSAESVAYTRVDTGHDSCTIWAYADGKRYQIVGCRGNLRIPIRAGQIGMWLFDMWGIMLVDPADASLPSITYDAVVPSPAQGITFSLGGFTPDLISAEYNIGTELELLPDATAANAIDQIAIAEYIPELTARIFAPTIAQRDIYSDSEAATALTLDIDVGSTQYNRWKLDIASGVHINPPDHQEERRFNALDLTCSVSVHDTITFD